MKQLIKIGDIKNPQKISILIGADAFLTALTFIIAWELWFFPERMSTNLKYEIALFVGVKLLIFWKFKLYKYLWRYASIKAVVNIVSAVTASAVCLVFLSWLLKDFEQIPVPIFLIDWAFSLLAIGGFRISLRVLREIITKLSSGKTPDDYRRVLIIGAGDAGDAVAREIKRADIAYELVGFIDDNPQKKGTRIHGFPVLGSSNDIHIITKKYAVDKAIIAIPSAEGKVIRKLISICEEAGITYQSTPGLFEIMNGRISMSQIRDVKIEDLLGRKVLENDLKISMPVAEETILVTGAGGSIGSELARQLCQLGPKKLVLVENSEYAMYKIDQEINSIKLPQTQVVSAMADVQNFMRLKEIFDEHKPTYVYHAAAYKHVPLMEENVAEVIRNNIWGTRNVISLSDQTNVKKFVLISTDKAVHPSNAMGASKRACEMLMQCQAEKSKTVFTAVRFGNVLGSKGSVVPLFKRQIKAGGPITVTDPEMTRYFMTIPEAVRLVIKAGIIAEGGEIFILDMGEPVKILNLAKDMIHLSGLEEGRDIEIQFTGLRPGEKLHEALAFDKEELTRTVNQKIFKTSPPKFDCATYTSRVESLIKDTTSLKNTDLRKALITLVS